MTVRRGSLWIVIATIVCAGAFSAPARAYEPDVHFYVVHLLLRARGYTAVEAQQFAGFSQYVDDNARTEPIYCWFPRRTRFHFSESGPDQATPANAQSARRQLTNAFAEYRSGNPEARYLVGAALHLFADTYSHQTFTAWPSPALNTRLGSRVLKIGHWDTGQDGHAPDRPYNVPQTALDAASELYQLIPASSGPNIPWTSLEPVLRAAFSNSGDQLARSNAVAAITTAAFPSDPIPLYDKRDFAWESIWFQWAVLR